MAEELSTTQRFLIQRQTTQGFWEVMDVTDKPGLLPELMANVEAAAEGAKVRLVQRVTTDTLITIKRPQ